MMAAVRLNRADIEVIEQLQSMIGLPVVRFCCCEDKSLFVGLGELVETKSTRGLTAHGLWEIGTYRGGWRVIQGGQIICGIRDAVDATEDLCHSIGNIQLGRLNRICSLSDFDTRFEFENGFLVDILAENSDGDEVAHVFCPNHVVAVLSVDCGWRLGPANAPWNPL